MKYLLINVVCGIKSTGRICTDLALELEKEGHEVKIAYGRDEVPEEYKRFAHRIGNDFDVKMHVVQSRLFDNNGLCSKRVTKRFIEWIKDYNPDVIHLHNIHGYYINYEILFNYLKACGKEIKWTLHDCWAFTGHCSYYSYINCNKWTTLCENCSQRARYPKSIYIDNSKKNYLIKKQVFSNVPNLSIFVPSNWLKEQVKMSFLSEYPIGVVPNKVDKDIFYKRESDFRKIFGLDNKVVILGVASDWTIYKGINDFIKLSEILDSKKFQIVIIGLTEKQKKLFKKGTICLGKTNSQNELAEIYSSADIYLNLSREETFGLTTLEAISCGAKTIVYSGTANNEIAEKNAAIIVDSFDELIKEITYNN